jgi:hypothetical protein
MPWLPSMNWVKKVTLKPMNTSEPGDARPVLVVHLAEHLGPPVVQAAEEADHRAAHHHVVEVRDDEVRVVQVDVGGQRAEEQPVRPPMVKSTMNARA